MNINFDASDFKKLAETLEGFSTRRLAAAVATGLTRAGAAVQKAVRAEMVDSFDRPTRYTLGAVYLKTASATSLEAEVGIRTDASGGRPPIKWLRWQVQGGLRRLTGFERALIKGGAMDAGDRAIPGPYAKLDAFGNMSRGQMAQVLSQLRVETGRAGSTRVMRSFDFNDTRADLNAKRRKMVSAYSKAGGQFVAFPHGRGKAKPGLYLVDRFNRADLQPVLWFASKAEYEPIFDFYSAAKYAAGKHLGVEIERAVRESMARLLAKQGGAGA